MSENRTNDVVEAVAHGAPPEGTEVMIKVDGKEVLGTVVGHLALCTGWYRVKTVDGRIVTMRVPK